MRVRIRSIAAPSGGNQALPCATFLMIQRIQDSIPPCQSFSFSGPLLAPLPKFAQLFRKQVLPPKEEAKVEEKKPEPEAKPEEKAPEAPKAEEAK